jgi:hypothetical protein
MSTKYEKVMFDFRSAEADPVVTLGVVLIRAAKMVLEIDCPGDPRSYTVVSRPAIVHVDIGVVASARFDEREVTLPSERGATEPARQPKWRPSMRRPFMSVRGRSPRLVEQVMN